MVAEGVQQRPPWGFSFWRPSKDEDIALTEAPLGDTEADVSRLVATDEELLLEQHRPAGAAAEGEEEASTSYAAAGPVPLESLNLEQFKLLLAGGVAGAVSKSATAPLARLTILYQIKGLEAQSAGAARAFRLGVGAALRHIVHSEGARALWKGNGVTIIHRLPYSATNFWTYEHVNEAWKERFPSRGPFASGDVVRRLVSGGVAGMTACALAYPLDLVRTRLAAQTTQHYYRGIGHALSTIVADEGMVGLYRGLGATLLQVAPSLATNYATYETLRSYWLLESGRETPTVGMSLACGSAAGLVSSTVTFPLDLVRRRLQLQGQGGMQRTYPSYGAAFRSIARTEGLRGLYSGILPEYYKVVPGVAIAFCTYELMKAGLAVQTNSKQR